MLTGPIKICFILTRGHFFITLREEGKAEGREKQRCERSINQMPLKCARTRDRIHNLGMCPDQKSNTQPFVYGMMLQPTEPDLPGLCWTFLCLLWKNVYSVLCPFLNWVIWGFSFVLLLSNISWDIISNLFFIWGLPHKLASLIFIILFTVLFSSPKVLHTWEISLRRAFLNHHPL